MPTPPPNDAMEWGNIAQIWASSTGTLGFILSIWTLSRQRSDKALDGLQKSQDAIKTSFDSQLKELRADDARQFERIDKIEADIASVKADVRHLPTRDDVHKIELGVTALSSKLEARFEALCDKVDLVIQQNERAQDRLAEKEDRSK